MSGWKRTVDWMVRWEHSLPQQTGIESTSLQLPPQCTWQSSTSSYPLPPKHVCNVIYCNARMDKISEWMNRNGNDKIPQRQVWISAGHADQTQSEERSRQARQKILNTSNYTKQRSPVVPLVGGGWTMLGGLINSGWLGPMGVGMGQCAAGDTQGRVILLSLLIGAFWVLLYQVLHLEPTCHWRPDANGSDNIAAQIPRPLKPFYHTKVAVPGA